MSERLFPSRLAPAFMCVLILWEHFGKGTCFILGSLRTGTFPVRVVRVNAPSGLLLSGPWRILLIEKPDPLHVFREKLESL
ncbi:MAG: hypothetical protein R6V45_05725 [Oceanipulchritudo sp.]